MEKRDTTAGRAAPGTEEGWRVIAAAVGSARRHLGDGLASAYAIGSLAHGGFRRAVSDVDLALLTDHAVSRDDSAAIQAIARDVAAADLTLGHRLSIFHAPWGAFADPPAHARFPPIDRFDLVRHGVLVHGTDHRASHATTPSSDEIRAQAVDSALQRVTPEQLQTELEGLRIGGVTVHDATKLVLWPVRLQHVCDTGEATGSADAVAHYVALGANARHATLVRDGLAWRDLDVIPDPDDAQRRIAHDIHQLHAEVLARVAHDPHTPRRDELAARAREIAYSGSPPG